MGTFIRSSFATTDPSAPRIKPLIAKDSFAAAALGSTEVGGFLWTKPANTFSIKGGILDSGDTIAVSPGDCTINVGRSNGTLSAEVLALGAGNMAGLLFRGEGSSSYVYYARPGDHILAKKVGSAYTVIAQTGTTRAFAAGEKLQVVLEGSRIICSAGGVVSHDVVDASYAGTIVGVHTRVSSATNAARWDNFTFSE